MIVRRGLALLVLAVWVGVLAAVLLLGHRPAPFSDLKTAIITDWVDAVEVSGTLGAGSRGFEVVEVRWQRGLLRFSTQVVEESPAGAAGRGVRRDDEITSVLDRPVAEVLHDVDPAVEVQVVPVTATGPDVLGWRAPPWAGVVIALALVATLGLLTTGPQPRRATRWGWFWLMVLVPPVGLLGYLVLSGVTRRPMPPRPDLPGLGGGWAFVLGVVTVAAWASVTTHDVLAY